MASRPPNQETSDVAYAMAPTNTRGVAEAGQTLKGAHSGRDTKADEGNANYVPGREADASASRRTWWAIARARSGQRSGDRGGHGWGRRE
jgi:hypothetical protein